MKHIGEKVENHEQVHQVEAETLKKLKHKNPVTPYQGKVLSGVVRKTFLRGAEVDGEHPAGRLLRRGMA